VITIDKQAGSVTVMLSEAETKAVAIYLQYPVTELGVDSPALLEVADQFRELASWFDSSEGKDLQ
jgi:hypothetical protein